MDRYRTVGAVIAAAGSSSRMGGRDKLAEPLDGHSGDPADPGGSGSCPGDPGDRGGHPGGPGGGVPPAAGTVLQAAGSGARRQHPAGVGAERRPGTFAGLHTAAIHDGARPLVTPEVFARCIEAAQNCGAATAAVPVKDTIKLADEAGRVLDTPDRSRLWAVQTPQIFDRDRYLRAAEEAERRGLSCTDDCQLFEAMGWEVQLVMGDYRNLKLTTPEDFLAAGAYLEGIK